MLWCGALWCAGHRPDDGTYTHSTRHHRLWFGACLCVVVRVSGCVADYVGVVLCGVYRRPLHSQGRGRPSGATIAISTNSRLRVLGASSCGVWCVVVVGGGAGAPLRRAECGALRGVECADQCEGAPQRAHCVRTVAPFACARRFAPCGVPFNCVA